MYSFERRKQVCEFVSWLLRELISEARKAVCAVIFMILCGLNKLTAIRFFSIQSTIITIICVVYNTDHVLLPDHSSQKRPPWQSMARRPLGRQKARPSPNLLHRHCLLRRFHCESRRPSGPTSLRSPLTRSGTNLLS